jgi:hypothetical protein
VINPLIGVTADKFFPISKTGRLQLVFQTAGVLPITISNTTGTTATTAMQFKVTLLDFSLQVEYIDIGKTGMDMLHSTLPDNKFYMHGTAYRTSSGNLPAGSNGFQTILNGTRSSSVKSLFARFYEAGTNKLSLSVNGKYDSQNPLINSIAWNIPAYGKFPITPVNPLLNPSQSMSELQVAIGNWNSYSGTTSSIIPARYCVLSTGGTASGTGTTAGTQAWDYTTASTSPIQQSSFIFGENVEKIARRSCLSGLNCTSAPIFLEANLSGPITNSHTVYMQTMADVIYIVDFTSGEISVRL